MAQTIVRLSEEVINQIAAGETIENPASIVKELIENSLDAGAKNIEIAVEAGGQQWIQVEDDGCGMNREDALLCLERHATSKIRVADDLYALKTMGFRGEALAAIAAVSRFELCTSQGGRGTKVVAEGGQISLVEPCARNRGTTISARSLFYNVPARKKFQKSQTANAAQVTRTVETIALAHPETAFSLRSNGERIFRCEAQEKRARIEAILGPFRETVAANGIWGLLAAPADAKTQRRGQFLFVNLRPIFSPLIARAVQSGYGTRLAEGLYPPFVLFLELPPSEVDVNVHPQKREVRFREEGKIFRSVEEAVSSAFYSMPVTTSSFSFSEPDPLFPPFSFQEQPKTSSPLPLPLTFSERPLFLLGHFFFLESEETLLIDLRKAQARILFETLSERKGEIQTLIWPLEVAIDDAEIVEELQSLRIECRLIGNKRLAIDALPSAMEAVDFLEFFATWKEGKKITHAVHNLSQKKNFSFEQAISVWKQLMHCREKQFDPMGLPIWTKIELSDLERILKERK